MQTTTQREFSNESKNQLTKEILTDFKSRCYRIVENDLNIQTIENIINMLKYLRNGYLQDIELHNTIIELETLKNKLMEDKTTDIGTSIKLENNLIELIERSNQIEGLQ